MRTYWEDITQEEAVNRALYGGTYREKNGREVKILGAREIINMYKGKDISKNFQKKKRSLLDWLFIQFKMLSYIKEEDG